MAFTLLCCCSPVPTHSGTALTTMNHRTKHQWWWVPTETATAEPAVAPGVMQ